MNAMIPVAAAKNPFGQPIRLEVPAGLTIAEIVDLIPDMPISLAPRLVVYVNDIPVPVEYWRRVRPRPDGPLPVMVTVYVRMEGGSGGGKTKNILAVIATIALTVATAGLTAPLTVALGSALAAKAIVAGIGIVGSLLISALFKPPVSPGTTAGDQPLGAASLAGNVLARGAALSRVVGTHKIFPSIVSPPLTEIIEDDELAETVFGLDGPHRFADIRINDTTFVESDDIQIETREGLSGEPLLSLVTRQGFEDQVNRVLSEHILDPNNLADSRLLNQNDPASQLPRWERFISRNSPDEIWLTLLFPEGIWDSDSPTNTFFVPFRIRFKNKNDSQWINGPEMLYTRRRDQPFRAMIKIKWATAPNPLPTPPTNSGWRDCYCETLAPTSATDTMFGEAWQSHAQFDNGVGLQNLRNVAQYSDRVELFLDEATFPKGIYEIELMRGATYNTISFDEDGYFRQGLTVAEVPALFDYYLDAGIFRMEGGQENRHGKAAVSRIASVWNEYPINATGKALIGVKVKNKQLSSLSVVASGLIPVWNGIEWTGREASSNPSDNLRFVLSGERTVYPLPAAQLDDIDFAAFHDFCVANGLNVNFVSDGKNADDVSRIIAACGLGFIRPSDKYGVAWEHDRFDESPVQVFSPRNSRNFSWSNGLALRPGGLVITYLDASIDYAQTELLVYDDDIDETTVPQPDLDAVTYDGITSAEQATLRARFDLRQSRLRNVTYTLEAALESVICTRGSLVGVKHDVIAQVAGFARIKEVLYGSPADLVVGVTLDGEVPILGQPRLDQVADLTQVEDMTLLGLTSGMSISLKTGAVITKTLIGSPGDQSTVYFAEPFTAPGGLGADCHVTVGIVGQEYARMIVVDIKPRRNLTASLTLVDEAPAIHPLVIPEEELAAMLANLADALAEWEEINDASAISFSVTINLLTLQRATATALMGIFAWTVPPLRRDLEVLTKLRIAGTPTLDGAYASAVVRAPTGSTLYQFELAIRSGIKQVGWKRYFSGIASELDYVDFNWLPNTDYWLRASAIGTVLKGRAWADLPSASEAAGISLVASDSDHGGGSSLSVTGANFGAVAGGSSVRHLLLVFSWNDDDAVSPDAVIDAITIGGVGGIVINQAVIGSAGATGFVGVVLAAVPTGISGNISVTFDNLNENFEVTGYALYRIINLRSIVPVSAPIGASNIALTVPTGGFGVAAAARNGGSGLGAFTGSGAVTAYSGGRGGAGMLRTASGTVTHDSSGGTVFCGATFEFSPEPADNEAGAQLVEVTNAEVQAPGYAGLGIGSTVGQGNVTVRHFAVGFEEGTAPGSP